MKTAYQNWKSQFTAKEFKILMQDKDFAHYISTRQLGYAEETVFRLIGRRVK